MSKQTTQPSKPSDTRSQAIEPTASTSRPTQVTSNHRPRTSSHSSQTRIPAPSTSSTSSRPSVVRQPSQEPRLTRSRSKSREPSVDPTGNNRTTESAAVRYIKSQQQAVPKSKSNTNPTTMSSLNNTTVNVATAFRMATKDGAVGLVKGGRREDFPPLEQRRERAATEEEEEDEEEQENRGESRREESNQEHIKRAAESSASKKRKKTVVKDPGFRHREGETESSEEVSEEHETATNGKKGKKRAKVRSEDDDRASATASPRRPRRSTKPVDPSYKPSADPSFHPNNTSSSDEDSHEDGRRRRSRSKSKGGIGVDAIPRGQRDGEVWFGKGKKKRLSRGGAKSGVSSSSRRRTSDESVQSENREEGEGEGEGEGDDLGGMGYQDQDYGTPEPTASQGGDQQQEEDDHDQQTPPAPAQRNGGLTSFFLRRTSHSPPNTLAPPEVGTSRGVTSQRRSPFSLPSLSPFKRRTVEPSPDPAFSAFDRSLGVGQGQNESESSRSIDELSHLRNSSYDYSEEERLVQAMEDERRKKLQHSSSSAQASAIPARLFSPRQQQQAPGTPIGLTPAPKSGAYPLTPGSPVQNLSRRNGGKNRLPAPPSMLGQSASTEAQSEEEREGVWGRKCGNAVRPIIEFGEKVRRKLQDPLLDWAKILKAFGGALGVIALLLAIRYVDSSSASLPSFSSPRSYSPPTYTAPVTPPDNLDALISRLSSLESAFGKLSSSSDSDRSRSLHDRSTLDKLVSQLQTLETSFGSKSSGTREEIERLARERSKESEQVEGSIRGVKEDLDGLVRRVQHLSDAQRDGLGRIDELETGFKLSSHDLETLTSRFDKLSKDVENGIKSERITQLAIAAIEKKLPGKIGVRLDSSGRLEIDPTFWKHLKEAFVDKKEVEKTVEARVKALEKKLPSTGGGGLFGSKEKQTQQVAVAPAPPSWDDFLVSNEESLRSWIASDLEGRMGGDAFVSKKTFLDLLHREIKLLKRDFETKANENFEQMGQELLSKVAKQEEMRKKDAAYSLHHQQRQQHSSTGTPGPLTIKSTDGQNVTAVISSLVDSALLRYSKDVLARPDYALFTSGGRVIRSLTSPTYEPHPLSRSRAALAWITGASAPRGRPAVTALHPDSAPGSCWPFEGQHGQIGIQLSRRVIPSDITIEHISRDVALDGDVSSAPKDFEVWAVVEGQENVLKLAQYRKQQLEAKRSAQTPTSLEDALNEEEPASLPPSPNHLLLSIGTYDPSSISPIQTFPVTPAARQLSIPVQVVVVKILSNQGEPAYTCLYRVRVSGTTETQQRTSHD